MKRALAFVLAAMTAITVTGCRSAASRHTYLLIPDESLAAQAETKARIRVTSISLPVYLSRRELVQLVDKDELKTVSNVMLAETLDSSVRSVLEQNFARLSAAEGAAWNVRFEFRHLELTDHGTVRLEAVVRADGVSEMQKVFAFETPLAGQVHAVRAYSAALAELSKQVVQWLSVQHG